MFIWKRSVDFGSRKKITMRDHDIKKVYTSSTYQRYTWRKKYNVVIISHSNERASNCEDKGKKNKTGMTGSELQFWQSLLNNQSSDWVRRETENGSGKKQVLLGTEGDAPLHPHFQIQVHLVKHKRADLKQGRAPGQQTSTQVTDRFISNEIARKQFF